MSQKMKTRPIKVSMVVPVCNVAAYLAKALDSVLAQTLSAIEVICVDDGSTDASGAMLDAYAAKDARLRVIHQVNAGYGHAVNVGLDAARGRYVGILEPDDWLQPDMLAFLYAAAVEHRAQLCRADYGVFCGDGREFSYRQVVVEDSLYERLCNPQQLERTLFYSAIMNWTGIMERQFLTQWQIRHHESPGAAYQDNGFWFQLFCRAERVWFVPKLGYMYRQDNPASSNKNRQRLFSMNEEYAWIYAFLTQHPELHKFRGMYWKRKYENNLFTLYRIGDEYHRDFLAHFQEEFRSAQARGELDRSWFTKETWADIQLLQKDVSAFYRKRLAYALSYPWQPGDEAPEISVLVLPDGDLSVLDSLARQTWRNFEILVIDDGSAAVRQADEAVDRRLRRIQSAGTAGMAAALAAARGRYVTVLEGRDGVTENLLEGLHTMAQQTQADLVGCGFAWAAEGKLVRQFAFRQAMRLQGTAAERLRFEQAYPDWGFPGGKLYRRTLFTELPADWFTGELALDTRLLHLWAAAQGKEYRILPAVLYQRNLPLRQPDTDPMPILLWIWRRRQDLPAGLLAGLGNWLAAARWNETRTAAVAAQLGTIRKEADQDCWMFLQGVARREVPCPRAENNA